MCLGHHLPNQHDEDSDRTESIQQIASNGVAIFDLRSPVDRLQCARQIAEFQDQITGQHHPVVWPFFPFAKRHSPSTGDATKTTQAGRCLLASNNSPSFFRSVEVSRTFSRSVPDIAWMTPLRSE